LGSITYLEFGRLLHSLNKTKHKGTKIPASFCNNIVNLEIKEFKKKYSSHAHYIMPNIFIQINEGIAKFFTLTIECHLNKVMELKCNICIILGYLHSP
jgi:hypothetical protein